MSDDTSLPSQLPLFSEPPSKRCSKCNNTYPLTSEFWYWQKREGYKSGYINTCKICGRIATNNQRRGKGNYFLNQEKKQQKEILFSFGFKRCAGCGEIKPLNMFSVCKDSKDGLKYSCKECHCFSGIAYSKANPEKRRESTRRWVSNNRELVNMYARRRTIRNPIACRNIAAKSRKNNSAKRREEFYRRRARKANAEGSFTEVEVQKLYQKQQGLCFHCGTNLEGTGFHRDHWIALNRGGSNWIENIRLLCPFCNQSKGDKLPWEWKPDRYSPPE